MEIIFIVSQILFLCLYIFFFFGDGIMDFIVTLFLFLFFIFILSGPLRNVGHIFSLASKGLLSRKNNY